MTHARALSRDARLLLERVHHSGGCAYTRLPDVVYETSARFPAGVERMRLGPLLRSLERRGLVAVRRDWGTLGYGKPTWIEVTPRGAASLEAAPSRHASALALRDRASAG